jgi:hypothetical protein
VGQGRPYKSSLKYLVSAHLEREMQRDEVEGGRGEGGGTGVTEMQRDEVRHARALLG